MGTDTAADTADLAQMDDPALITHWADARRRLALTPKEFAVLECLLAADGRPVPAEELLQRVWDEAADPFTTTVKTTIRRLRAKLGDPPLIETLRESGYRIGGP